MESRRWFVLCLGFICGMATCAQGQVVDISGSVGYSAARGFPPPNLPVVGAGVTLWPGERWGFGWSVTYGPGKQEDTSLLGTTITARELLFHRFNLFYQRPLNETLAVRVGGGLLIHARYDQVTIGAGADGHQVTRTTRERWSGFSTVATLQARATALLSVQSGLILDFALDRWYFQPVVMATVSF